MAITPSEFVNLWAQSKVREQQGAQTHFNQLCEMVGHKTPIERDPAGEFFTFEEHVEKATGGKGRADVWHKGHFAWEYKGKHKDLDAAYAQLLAYRSGLGNPPLLVVCDFLEYRIYPQWPNTSGQPFVFRNEDLLHRDTQRYITWLLESPERFLELRQEELERRERITKDLAEKFAHLADLMRQQRGADGQPLWSAMQIARFLTKITFLLFAQDIGLLPRIETKPVFSFLVEGARRMPQDFVYQVLTLFQAMEGLRPGFMTYPVPYFNGGLFADSTPGANDGLEVLDLTQIPGALDLLQEADNADWRFVNPTIFGTLFEGALDPGKRAQLGAHYTGESDIRLVVEPVLMQPLYRLWDDIQAEAAPLMQLYLHPDTPPRPANEAREHLVQLHERMLQALGSTRVLDPACGSGNFLYVSLRLMKDLEGQVRKYFEPVYAAFPAPFRDVVTPRQLYGIEKDEFAARLAYVVTWIGYLQWRYEDEGVLHPYLKASSRPHPRELPNPIFQEDPNRILNDDAIMRYRPHPPAPSPLRREGEQGAADSLPSLRSGEGPGVGSNIIHTRTSAELWEKIKPLAREMRTNPTPAEDQLWQRVRGKEIGGYRFRRQHPIDRFIVDFYCAEARLVVEVDGPIHEYTPEEDALRQEFLESLGLQVLRFTNDEVLYQLEAVLERIRETVENPPDPLVSEYPHPPTPSETEYPHPPTPSPLRREGEQDAADSLPSLRSGEGPGVGRMIPYEPDWPEADVIMGNPPFLGGKRMRSELKDQYVDDLFALYEGRVPHEADLVCYWYEKARAQIENGKAKRAGLLATQSIRAGANREVLERIKQTGDIFMAWGDRPWVLEGAAVRISIVGFDDGSQKDFILDGAPVIQINSDLQNTIDATKARELRENKGMAFQGPVKVGAFDIPNELAQTMLKSKNQSGRDNSEVVKSYLNGNDIVQRTRNYWIIDFGLRSEVEASQYEAPFRYVEQYIKPERLKNRDRQRRENWWRLGRSGEDYKQAASGLSRQIFTPRVARHRIFVWAAADVMPDSRVFAIARDDDYFFGVLHSTVHELWSLRLASWHGVGNDPTYNASTCFETFPFPWPPGQEDTASPHYAAIADAARALHEERDAWLNPPDELLNGPARDRLLRERTLTNLYNALEEHRRRGMMHHAPTSNNDAPNGPRKAPTAAQVFAPRLAELHDALDRAVLAAYGWDDIRPHPPAPSPLHGEGERGGHYMLRTAEGDEALLRRLLGLNLERAGR